MCLADARNFALAVLVCVILVGCVPRTPYRSGDGAGADAPESALRRVSHVYDGDTIVLGSPRETVRLIGINAPERDQPFYTESRDQLRAMLEGASVRLEHDVEARDRHGRSLAYARLPDGRHVNLEMVRSGYALALTIPPNVAYSEQFRAAEREARSAGSGLWQPSTMTLRFSGLEANPAGPDDANLNGEWVEISNEGVTGVNLLDVTVSDEGNNTFTFPGYDLVPGGRVRVHSGAGESTKGSLYWDHQVPVWNNSGDTALLRDPEGHYVDILQYVP